MSEETEQEWGLMERLKGAEQAQVHRYLTVLYPLIDDAAAKIEQQTKENKTLKDFLRELLVCFEKDMSVSCKAKIAVLAPPEDR